MTNNTIINVGRSFGSGGGFVGKDIGRKLGIPVFDNELISKAAEESGYSKTLFAKGEEKSLFSVSSFFASGRLSYLDNGYVNDNMLFNIQSEVIRSIADKGDAVIIGRCADYILRDRPCLNVFVDGPEEYRIRRLMENEHLTAAEAEKLEVKNSAPKPIVRGRNLIDMGLRPGVGFNRLLRICYEAQLDGRIKTLDEGISLIRSEGRLYYV